jgi:hypothetical protein
MAKTGIHHEGVVMDAVFVQQRLQLILKGFFDLGRTLFGVNLLEARN